MKVLGSKKLSFVVRVTALFCAFVLYAPVSAHAVTTPSKYCSTVSGCEILNVTIGGIAIQGGIYNNALISYCKNYEYRSIPVEYGRNATYSYTLATEAGTAVSAPFTSASLCPYLP